MRSIRYKSLINKLALYVFAISFIALGYLGLQTVTTATTFASRFFTFIYFAYLIGLPWISRMGQHKEPPERVTGHG